MCIRNLSLRFSLRPQPCLSAYKCAALLSQQSTQQHSLPFAQALGSELKCACVLSKRPAACFISLWVPDHAIGHPTEIFFSLYLSLTLQGTSSLCPPQRYYTLPNPSQGVLGFKPSTLYCCLLYFYPCLSKIKNLSIAAKCVLAVLLRSVCWTLSELFKGMMICLLHDYEAETQSYLFRDERLLLPC